MQNQDLEYVRMSLVGIAALVMFLILLFFALKCSIDETPTKTIKIHSLPTPD